jgi:hypothetical protein
MPPKSSPKTAGRQSLHINLPHNSEIESITAISKKKITVSVGAIKFHLNVFTLAWSSAKRLQPFKATKMVLHREVFEKPVLEM